MSGSRVVPVLTALLAVSALGATATSLETTLTTDPDEEINPNWNRLPISQGEAAAIEEEIIESDGDDTSATEANEAAGEGATDGSGGDGEGVEATLPATDETRASRDSNENASKTGVESGTVPAQGESSPDDSLLALLASILRTLVPVLTALGLAALAYRYRETIHSLLGFGSTDEATSEPASESEAWPGAEPANVVDRAWVTMVQRADPERPETTTTAECRALARERGLDAAGVEAIATAFERVHYGGVAVADEADRAREGLKQLNGGTDD
jgi:hypothetical protein